MAGGGLTIALRHTDRPAGAEPEGHAAGRPGTVRDSSDRSPLRRAMVASTIGTSLEWYDFFLYGSAAALVFPKLFFPSATRYVGVIEAFATFAVGFLARPIGAAIFGHFGDRIGRKNTLIVTLLLMGIASCAIGLLPTAASIGAWAGVPLVALRVVQGIGVGGEWGGSVLLAMEWSGSKRRGFVGSWPQLGVPIGLLLSSGVMALTMRLTGDAFETTGWRWPFLLSIVLIGIGLAMRLRVEESPEFTRLVREHRVRRRPVSEALHTHRRAIVLTSLMRLAEQTPFYLFTAFVLSYGTERLGMDRSLLVAGTLAAAALALFTVPFFGWLSDRTGRKRLYLLGAGLTLAMAVPYVALLDTAVPVVVFATIGLSLIPHDMQYGPQAALIAEAFPPELRYSGSSLGYQFASVLAGGPAPLIATWLIHTFDSGYAISAYIAVTAVITLIATALLPAWRPSTPVARDPAADDSAAREAA
jgi:MFS family permease